MNKTYKLNIEKPCKKATWSEMKFSDKTKFCSLCSRKVFDFMNWTDEEIIDFLNSSDENICARLSYRQINRVISIKEKSKIIHWRKIVASIIILLSSTSIYAIEKNTETIERLNQQYNSVILNDKINYQKSFPKDSIKNTISGKLIEEISKNPIPNIIIEVKDTNIEVETDSLGNFEIIIPKSYSKKEIVLVVITGYGFEGKTERTIYKNELPITNLIIEKPEVLIGEVIYYKPKKWWQFWKKR